MARTRVAICRQAKCTECGEPFDFLFKLDDDTSVDCRRCGGVAEIVDSGGRSYWRPFTPYYHHGLDQFFQTRSDEKNYAKSKGLVNISGDFGKRMAERKSPKEALQEKYLRKKLSK